MPATQIDQSDAQELVEILQLLTDWITTDPDQLNTSLTRFVGNPAYGTSQLAEEPLHIPPRRQQRRNGTFHTAPVITATPRTN
jgi:hypothetical protein